jgi:imidazolonepropionase-like amidohydrolase
MERGADIVKIMASGNDGPRDGGGPVPIPRQELAAVVAQAHAAGLPVAAHAHALVSIRDAVAAGVDSDRAAVASGVVAVPP